uniref:Uncharacterized protein LOC104244814 n=1 Tax=Nicotiana sylvestris TaxID=4096 RepID=A0A1U7Y3A7_NICSY|nr:PREDICTED: uncharacterized protein LOC104244814 [Nicotiana sylvestris]
MENIRSAHVDHAPFGVYPIPTTVVVPVTRLLFDGGPKRSKDKEVDVDVDPPTVSTIIPKHLRIVNNFQKKFPSMSPRTWAISRYPSSICPSSIPAMKEDCNYRDLNIIAPDLIEQVTFTKEGISSRPQLHPSSNHGIVQLPVIVDFFSSVVSATRWTPLRVQGMDQWIQKILDITTPKTHLWKEMAPKYGWKARNHGEARCSKTYVLNNNIATISSDPPCHSLRPSLDFKIVAEIILLLQFLVYRQKILLTRPMEHIVLVHYREVKEVIQSYDRKFSGSKISI